MDRHAYMQIKALEEVFNSLHKIPSSSRFLSLSPAYKSTVSGTSPTLKWIPNMAIHPAIRSTLLIPDSLDRFGRELQ